MDESPQGSDPISEAPRESRVLAAIVFTDAVAFSKLAGLDEKAAFAILNRDFELMTTICRSHGGRVLNTMGDGMLMCFGSAVEAMQCAQKIQQALHAQGLHLPKISVLQHRIGVHLGDIIIDGDNVFGDGVNVAARLQAECKPGAVCYSRMVADVIKNKIQVRGRFLGLRQLKNIAEPVHVYEVPSLSEYVTEDDPIDRVEPLPAEDGASGSKAAWMVAGSVGLLILVALAFLFFQGPNGNAFDAKASGKSKGARRQNSSPSPTTSPAPKGPDTGSQLAALKQTYDFAGMASVLEGVAGDTNELNRVRGLISMRRWLEHEITLTTVTRALLIEDGVKMYQGTRGVAIESRTGLNETPFEQLPPSDVLAALTAALRSPPSGLPPPDESATWISGFRAEYPM